MIDQDNAHALASPSMGGKQEVFHRGPRFHDPMTQRRRDDSERRHEAGAMMSTVGAVNMHLKDAMSSRGEI
jgi:hypothetical protein